MARQPKPKDDASSANLGFEAKMWLAADKLRNNMDAAEYKHVVLGLIFLKYISDTFEEQYTKLKAGKGPYAGANPEDKDEYRAENVFWVPKESRWSHLQANAKQPTVGKLVDDAMVAIERDNPRLKGVLPKEYARPGLDKQRLGELIDLIATITLTGAREGDASHRSVDLLGRVYEYFLTRFASAEGKNGGQFYTPSCIVRLFVEMLAPYKGRIYDPCCGSGGMFTGITLHESGPRDRSHGFGLKQEVSACHLPTSSPVRQSVFDLKKTLLTSVMKIRTKGKMKLDIWRTRYRLGFISILFVQLFLGRLPLCLAQETSTESESSSHAPAESFKQVVTDNFAKWDQDADGTLSRREIDAALNNPKVKGEAAAAVVAIEHVVRGGKYALPPLTLEFLVKSPAREKHESKEDEMSADDSSKALSFSHAPSFVPRYGEAIKRISTTSRDLFPQTMPSFEGVHQGVGDCPFVSTVGALVHRDPSFIKKMISENGNGSFTVSFGDGQSIKLNHITDGDIGMWTSAGTNGLWLTVLEKAYRRALLHAKIPHKSQEEKDAESIYDQFGSGHTVQIFTGHETHRVELKDIKDGTDKYASLRHQLKTTLSNHLVVKAGTSKHPKMKVPHIAGEHAYAVLGFDDKNDMLEVFNPWGNTFAPKGEEGLDSGYITKGGIFHLPLRDAIRIFEDFVFETQSAVHL